MCAAAAVAAAAARPVVTPTEGSLFPLLDLLSFFVEEASMGAQFSKTAAKGEAAAERPGEAAVASSPSKANGQVNFYLWFWAFLGCLFSNLDASSSLWSRPRCIPGKGAWPDPSLKVEWVMIA